LKHSVAPEMRFRRFVSNNMVDHWQMCWHEDREISPGVPDLHYILRDSDSQRYPKVTGWLELKALDEPLSKSNRIKVEPSQKQWMPKWGPLVPVHFLVRIERQIFLFGWYHAAQLGNLVDFDEAKILSITNFFENDIQKELPKTLKLLTA
jgi:hypothetical protein